MLSRTLSATLKRSAKPLLSTPHRSVSLLVNDLELTEEQKMIQQTAYDFAREELLPHAAEWDQQKFFPKETMRKAAELGFGAIYTSEQYGGCDLSRVEASLIFEGLASGCPTTSAYMSIHNMTSYMIDSFANDELKKEWLPQMSTLEWFSSYCLTEPNSGSDAQAMKTFAKEDGDQFIINGSKVFISGASTSDIYIV